MSGSLKEELLRLGIAKPKAEEAKPHRIQLGTAGQPAMSGGQEIAPPEGGGV